MEIEREQTEDTAVARQVRLENLLRERWMLQDPEAVLSSRLRPDGKVEITLVSALFEGKEGREREALFWPAFDPAPKSELIYMTYSLLLTPAEAARHFPAGQAAPVSPAEDWDE